MAYTICKNGRCTALRVIVPDVHGVPEVKAEFTPFWWACDPCNTQDRRYEVTYREGQSQPAYFAWYQVVTTDDTQEDIQAKLDFYGRVLGARSAVHAAAVEYRRLTGCGWSAIPL